MRIYNTSLDYSIGPDHLILLQELRPNKPYNYGLAQVLTDIAEVERIVLEDYRVLFKNKMGFWGRLSIRKGKAAFLSSKQKEYALALEQLIDR